MDAAFSLMRGYARRRNERLSEVAAAVAAGRLNATMLGSTRQM